MRTAALAVGIAVLLLTTASQAGLLGPHDFAALALVGLLGALFSSVIAVTAHSRAALVGLVLSLSPVALLAYYLSTSEG